MACQVVKFQEDPSGLVHAAFPLLGHCQTGSGLEGLAAVAMLSRLLADCGMDESSSYDIGQ